MDSDCKAYHRQKEQLLAEIEQLIQELEQLRSTDPKGKTALAAGQLENKLQQLVALKNLKQPNSHLSHKK